jgi:short-subunit dehydrogenase
MALPTPATGRPVVVTGASSGIGEALAGELAARGHDLVLVARREDRLRELAARLEAEHLVAVEVRPADLTDVEVREALTADLARRPLAGLCNNAGVGSFGRFHETDPEALERLVSLNVAALCDLTAAVVAGMVQRGEGAVLNVASILGHGPQPFNAAYAASKAFAIALSEAVHTELAGTGVSCTVLSPGPVRTDIFGASSADALRDLGPSALWQDPEDVARAAVDAMEAGVRSATPGVTNQLAAAGGRFLPRTLSLPVQHVVAAALPGLRRRLGL